MNTTNLTQARELRSAKFVSRLKELCTPIDFPRQEIDQVDGAVITVEGVAMLKEMFSMFGVSELDPESEDFDLVLNTWVELSSTVWNGVRLDTPFSDVLNERLEASVWTPEFTRYVHALRDGDTKRIAECADVLGIRGGIAEGAPRVYKRPTAPE